MNKDELISNQQLEIETLKESIEDLYCAMENIDGALYNIGAPLNDNILGFNHVQRQYLKKNIACEIIGRNYHE